MSRTWNLAVLPGGGVKGALTLDPLRRALGQVGGRGFDGLFGVSVGGLHAAMLGQASTATGQLVQLALTVQIYREIRRNSDLVSVPFPGGVIGKGRGLVLGGGIYEFRGLRRLLERYVDLEALRNSGVHVEVGAVCLEAGRYSGVTPHRPQFLRFVEAGASVPGQAQAVVIDGQHWVDGGVMEIAPLRPALAWARQHVPAEDTVRLWVFCTGPLRPKPAPRLEHGLAKLMRAMELHTLTVLKKDLDRVVRENRALERGEVTEAGRRVVEVRVFEPEVHGPAAYDFRPEGIAALLEEGQRVPDWSGWIT